MILYALEKRLVSVKFKHNFFFLVDGKGETSPEWPEVVVIFRGGDSIDRPPPPSAFFEHEYSTNLVILQDSWVKKVINY